MKFFRRITLLGSFAAVGVAMAVAIMVATAPSQESPLANKSGMQAPADPVPATAPAAVKGAYATATTTRSGIPAGAAPDRGVDHAAPLSIPAGALIAEPHPPIAFQARPEDVQKAIEYLRQRLGAGAGGQPEAIPAPLPGPEASSPPGMVPAPLPSTGPDSSGSGPTLIPRKNRITRAVPGEGDDHLTIHIQNTDLREVLEMLSEEGGLNILASNSVQGKVSATLNDVDVDSALQAILRSTGFISRREGRFIYVGTPADFEAMQQAIDTVGTRVYRPNYLTADDLKTLITPLLTQKIGVCSVSAPAEIGIATDDDKVGGDGFAGGEVVLVRDYEAVLVQIDQVVSEVDIRPSQVAIEATILSVKLDDTNKWGVDFQLLRNNPNIKFGWGKPLGSLADLKFEDGGLKFGFLDSDLGTFISALETIGDTNVIATPRVLVLNKHRADILIGKEEGYVSTTQTETAKTQSVEFLDIGAQLRIRPFISTEGLIRMEVHPELSDGLVRDLAGFTVPRKDVTKVTSNIMVRDGCTVIIGGLMREQLQTTTTQIPFFGSLPVVGVAFRHVDEETKREEVIILITPRIVHDMDSNAEARLAGDEFDRRQAVYAEKMSAAGKRHVARRYLRMAQEALNRGNQNQAIRFVELAVHFDPLNLDAIELRSQLFSGDIHLGPPPISQEVIPGSAASPLDSPAIAPWLLEGLEHPGTPAGSQPPTSPAPPKDNGIRQPGQTP